MIKSVLRFLSGKIIFLGAKKQNLAMGPTFWPKSFSPFSSQKVQPTGVPFLYTRNLNGALVKTYKLNKQKIDLPNRYL